MASLSGRISADDKNLQPAGNTVRVLILSGQGDHDWRATTHCLRRLLADTGRFDVRVCESPAGLTARTLADFDVLVDDQGGLAPGSDTEKAIAAFVESGKGLVVTHGALGSYADMPTPDGNKRPARSEPARTVQGYWPAFPFSGSHAPVQFLKVKFARPEHPIVRGMNSEFMTADAHFRGMAVHPAAEVIATAVDDTKSGGNDEPILLTSVHGKGRVFCSALGHDPAAMLEKEFIATFARGTEWAATGRVTLPADLGPPRPNADAVRGLLITGGHDHETSFYSLFDGHKDLASMPVASSTTAFQTDLRPKYDVVIMYDFSRDLDATGRKNLRDFVESGKGIVVLHHALLDYQQWPWWYEEVVGGRYRLKPEGNIPASTVKADQQIFVTPEGQHPITAGIGPFHIVDETYKRMWISPLARPLLSTDNGSSDRSLAWIGPSAKFKVVAIQLGHGHTAFGHPAYRALVHNAILWSAGRIK
ncbi:MAG: ThuA domain-containing protein [Isosphaerales bacterium]